MTWRLSHILIIKYITCQHSMVYSMASVVTCKRLFVLQTQSLSTSAQIPEPCLQTTDSPAGKIITSTSVNNTHKNFTRSYAWSPKNFSTEPFRIYTGKIFLMKPSQQWWSREGTNNVIKLWKIIVSKQKQTSKKRFTTRSPAKQGLADRTAKTAVSVAI